MCGCKAHWDEKALCTCNCPLHDECDKMPEHEHEWLEITGGIENPSCRVFVCNAIEQCEADKLEPLNAAD